MPLPKAVIFDLGKVLLDFDYDIAIRRLLPLCDKPISEVHGALAHDGLLVAYETGLVSTPEFFERLRTRIGYRGTLATFHAGFSDIFTPIPAMVALHAEVRAREVPTYVLSNTNEIQIEFVRAQFPFFANFDGYVLSFEHRAMKPGPALYEVAERMSGLHGPDLFYLDDRSENVEAGWHRGWQGLVHRDPAETRAALVRSGVLDAQ